MVVTPHKLQRGRDKQRQVVLKKPTTRYYRTLPLALTRRPPRHRPRLAFPGRLATNPSEKRGALLIAWMSPYDAPATRRGAKRWPLHCGREPRGHRLGRRIAEASGFGEGGRGPDGLPAKLVLCEPLMRSETCSMWSALSLTCRCVCSCTRSIDAAGGSLFVACLEECVLARFLGCLLARTIAVVAVRCR